MLLRGIYWIKLEETGFGFLALLVIVCVTLDNLLSFFVHLPLLHSFFSPLAVMKGSSEKYNINIHFRADISKSELMLHDTWSLCDQNISGKECD